MTHTIAGDMDRKSYALYHHDGLLDVFIGLGALAFGVGLLNGFTTLAAIVPAILLPIWQLARKAITYPRIEEYDLSPEKAARSRLALMTIIGVICFGLGVLFFLIFSFDDLAPRLFFWLKEYFLVVFGALAAVVLGIVGLALGSARMHVYAGLALLCFAGGWALGLDLPLSVTTFGGLVLLGGAVVLARFLRQNPIR